VSTYSLTWLHSGANEADMLEVESKSSRPNKCIGSEWQSSDYVLVNYDLSIGNEVNKNDGM
jgi:hypothetical protein